MVVSRGYVDVPVDGRGMRTFVAAPRSGGPHPGVVFYSDVTRRQAKISPGNSAIDHGNHHAKWRRTNW